MNSTNQKIPEGWSVKKLGDIGKVSMCKRIMKHETNPDKGIPFYKIGTFGGKPDAYISSELYLSYKNKYSYPKKGDILISAAGTIGRTVIFDGADAYFQDSNIVWISNDETKALNRYLLYYYTTSPWYTTTGGAISRLYNENISNAKIFLPPLLEQEKIAGILGTWDEAIEKLSGLIEQKKLLKKGLMQRLLTSKTRLPGFTQPWKEVKLKEMGHITSAGVDKNIVPGEQNVILLNYMDIYRKDFIYKDDIKQVVTAPDRKIKNCNVLKADVFFTPSSETRDDIGHSAVIMENIPGAVYSYHIIRFRPFLNHLTRDFCAYAFKTSKFYKQTYSLCEGSGQRYVLSQDYFRNMSICIPTDLEEQQAIADVLSTADEEIDLLNKKLEALKEQKKGLMQQLLTGQTRVKVN